MNSQSSRLLEWLKSGSPISRLESLAQLGILELSARICELENRGYVIRKRWINVENRFGEIIKVKEYSYNFSDNQ